jgi:DegV family protein with EDD domain
MNHVQVITDSACDLTDEQATAANVTVVPLSIRFGTEEFTDRVQLSADQFWARMASTPGLPETAAPSPGAFEAAFRAAQAAGASGVVCITISAALSATHQSAVLAARALADEFPVTVIDSKSITAGQGTMVLAAAAAAGDGETLHRVAEVARSYIGRSFVYGTIDSLDNLRKGGRIGGAQAMLGSLLAIKPLINVSTGTVEEAGKQRTRSRALGTLVGFLGKSKTEHGSVSDVAVMHGNASDADLATLLQLLSEHVDPTSITVGRIGAVIGTHGGLGVIGLCFVAPAAGTPLST